MVSVIDGTEDHNPTQNLTLFCLIVDKDAKTRISSLFLLQDVGI